jgi:hypothetical protein
LIERRGTGRIVRQCPISGHRDDAVGYHAGTAPFTFVTEGVEPAIAQAREFVGPDRDVDVAAGQIGVQALRLGLIDQVVMNVVVPLRPRGSDRRPRTPSW